MPIDPRPGDFIERAGRTEQGVRNTRMALAYHRHALATPDPILWSWSYSGDPTGAGTAAGWVERIRDGGAPDLNDDVDGVYAFLPSSTTRRFCATLTWNVSGAVPSAVFRGRLVPLDSVSGGASPPMASTDFSAGATEGGAGISASFRWSGGGLNQVGALLVDAAFAGSTMVATFTIAEYPQPPTLS